MTALGLAFSLASLAAALGAVLAVLHVRAGEGHARPPWQAGVVHGLLGAAALAALVAALQGPPRGVAQGAGTFGLDAAVLLGGALLAGVAFAWRRQRGTKGAGGLVLALHGVFAMFGYLILAAYASFD